jgi:hypothetical protein
MRDSVFSPRLALLAVALVALVLAAALLGVVLLRRGGSDPVPALVLEHGVPVVQAHTPAGALAAADNYLALSSQSLEQDPPAFATLVAQDYAPQVRASTLAEAKRLREADASDIAAYREGARAIAIVAARRLDSYAPNQATITSWLAGLLWGPHTPPRQSWNLVDSILRWQSGRWLVVSERVDSTPAPVPSRVYVNAGNDRYEAFTRLAGMSPPFYGAPGS